MRVVFEDYWQELREGMEQMGKPLPPPDLQLFIAELCERGVSEVRLCARWLHVMNVEAAGGALPANEAFARKPFVQLGTYILATARTPSGEVFEYRERHYPEQGEPHELLARIRAQLEEAGLRVLGGRLQY